MIILFHLSFLETQLWSLLIFSPSLRHFEAPLKPNNNTEYRNPAILKNNLFSSDPTRSNSKQNYSTFNLILQPFPLSCTKFLRTPCTYLDLKSHVSEVQLRKEKWTLPSSPRKQLSASRSAEASSLRPEFRVQMRTAGPITWFARSISPSMNRWILRNAGKRPTAAQPEASDF